MTMVEPASGLSPFITVPAPVWMPQPKVPIISRRSSLGTLMVLRS